MAFRSVGFVLLAMGMWSVMALAEEAKDDALRAAMLFVNSQKETLGLGEADGFVLRESHVDPWGKTHTHFQQYHGGVRVWGGDVIAHAEGSRGHGALTDGVVRGLSVAVTPVMEATQARAVVDRLLDLQDAPLYEPRVELVIYPLRQWQARPERASAHNAADFEYRTVSAHLAYHVRCVYAKEGLVQATEVMVDAHTGAVLDQWNGLQTEESLATGHSQYSGMVKIPVRSVAEGYELRDMGRGAGGNTINNMDHQGSHTQKSPELKGAVYTHNTLAWGDGQNYTGVSSLSANGQTAAVDAHYGLASTWDMYKNVLGRDGVDGKGRATFLRVHYGKRYENAFWLPEAFCATFGDGGQRFSNLTSVDVIAHELSHGVCEHNGLGGLIYKGESGALNEANADIMATFVTHYAYGAAGQGKAIPEAIAAEHLHGYTPWTITSQLGYTLRYMALPSKDRFSPDAWSPDLHKKDVHISCGPGNRMAYLLANGIAATGALTCSYLPKGMAGIGNDKTARIWYRALTTYFTPAMTYLDARKACIRAAQDLYGAGGYEEAAVWNAFAGVNVGEVWTGKDNNPHPLPAPAPLPSVAISPKTTTVKGSGMCRFTAKVLHSESKEVKWSAQKGDITQGIYRAPYTPGVYKVSVTLWDDAKVFDEAVVTVEAK